VSFYFNQFTALPILIEDEERPPTFFKVPCESEQEKPPEEMVSLPKNFLTDLKIIAISQQIIEPQSQEQERFDER
jgi:hypothetical protein